MIFGEIELLDRRTPISAGEADEMIALYEIEAEEKERALNEMRHHG